uniref:Nonstructural protein n=1 Tax=Chicken parvovirus TaxID=1136878 RepID=A0A1S6EM99_9VIRU|nr:nonstructural protein [Chicken parvovirus]
MAFPTRGGFSAILNLPSDLIVGQKNMPVFECVTAGYTSPDSGEFVASRFPPNHELRQEIRNFIGNPEWEDPDLTWIDFHIQLAKHAIDVETKLNPSLQIFWQMEKSSQSGRYHLHMLFVEGCTSRQITWIIKRMRREICNKAAEMLHMFCPDFPKSQIWGSLVNIQNAMLSLNRGYSPRIGKPIPQPVNPYSFLKYYMFNSAKMSFLRGATPKLAEKLPMGTRYARFEGSPDLDEGPEIPSQELTPGDTLPVCYVSTETDWGNGGGETVIKTSIIEKLCMEALRLCRENHIFTMKAFKLKFPDKFMQFSSRNQGLVKLDETINLYCETIIHDHNAWEIAKSIHGDVDTAELDDNLAIRLCSYQGYSPKYVARLILCWLSGQSGKKNALYFHGPANTGKTMMAESICKMVQIYGNVNHNNKNFPFNDCHNKAVLWWEECSMTDEHVESAKCIMGGSSVRIDKKNQDSVLLCKTPIVITSNNDITQVSSRNAISTVHAAAIRARCLKFTFNNWLTSNWGLITVEQMYQFLCWGELDGIPNVDSLLKDHPEFNGTLPFNQPKGKFCADCVNQFSTATNLTVCPACSGWTRKPFSEEEEPPYTGSESGLFEKANEGKNEVPGIYPVNSGSRLIPEAPILQKPSTCWETEIHSESSGFPDEPDFTASAKLLLKVDDLHLESDLTVEQDPLECKKCCLVQ